MSFPVPVKYNLTDDKNETVVVYNDGREERLLPFGPESGGGGNGGTVVAHGQISAFPQPGTPINVQLDKTYDDLVRADYSIIIINVPSGGMERGFYIPLISKFRNSETNEYQLNYGQLAIGTNYVYAVAVSSSGCSFTILNSES